jgi:ParB-like chromosome segregation protein Spo0J
MASKGIGNNVIPATIFTPAETPVDLLNLVTNLHRGTSTPYEEALVIHQTLTNRGTDDITLARMLNRSVVWIKSRLHLLSLPDDIQSLLAENSIPVSTATELSNIENPELRKQITRRVIDFGASARETKAWVNQLNASELTNQTRVSTLGTVLALNKNPDLKLTCFACDQEFNPSSLKSQLICTTCEKLLSGEGETGSPQAEISPPA